MLYLDSSAITKLLFLEPGTAELRDRLETSPEPVTSALARVEVPRAVARVKPGSVSQAGALLATLTVLGLDASILATASSLLPATLRTSDAIHLASAVQLGPDLDAFLTYDPRQAEAARAAGLPVESPGVELAFASDGPMPLDRGALQRVVDRLVGRLRPARILLPDEAGSEEARVVIVLGPWSPGRAASQLGREAIADLDVELQLEVIQDEDAAGAPAGTILYEGD
jgi:uncharacterized protein